MNTVETAWLAGILEGEGSFSSAHHNGPNSPRTPRVSVAMSDLDIIERVASLTGKRVISKPVKPTDLGHARKPMWQVLVYGAEAVDLMRTVLPFMGARRSSRIEGLIAAWYAERPHLTDGAAA